MQALHRIVVVGGGAGGLELVSSLGRKIGRLGSPQLGRPILVDSNKIHVWKPLYHELATGHLNTGEDSVNYFSHAYDVGVDFELGKMKSLDREKKVIKLSPFHDATTGKIFAQAREIKYNTLILAVGSKCNDFGTPGVVEHCISLDSIEEAENLRTKLLWQAFLVRIGELSCNRIRIGIIGGGPTGVELAAEIHHQFYTMRSHGRNFMSDQLEITLLEASPRILSSSTLELSKSAETELKKRSINVRVNTTVKLVTSEGFQLADGSFVPAEIRVWCAGVKAPNWLAGIGLTVNRNNQIHVNNQLQSVEDPNIFAIGDCALCPDGHGGFTSPTAQAAHQQAKWLTMKLIAQLKDTKTDVKPFKFKNKGILVSLGVGSAVGNLISNFGVPQNVEVSGKSAKILYTSLYRIHQTALFGWKKTGILWLAGKLRNTVHPQIKFH